MQLSDQRDAVIELVKLLTWIIEIFFKRCANVERQPRDCIAGSRRAPYPNVVAWRGLELTDGYSAIRMAQNSSGDAFGFRGADERRTKCEGERLEDPRSVISPAEAAACD
jgi:hypothetical protein